MPKIELIESLEDLISAIERLYEVIENARMKRIAEYKSKGRPVPHRIKFEELDLSDHKIEMLRVQKTLHWGRYNRRLGNYEQKAKVVAIAGICELIKDEYIGKFWDMYRRNIGLGATQTVYDWIWEKGFKKEGIQLIHNRGAWRREFVQTLVLESGIPRNRYRDVIDFFTLYWRYFRQYHDVENLIHLIAENKMDIDYVPSLDRIKMENLCREAVEYSRAFSHVVEKLSIVFDFLERSEDIFAGDLTEHIETIFQGCGVDPLEILHGEYQLKSLYDRILGLVTPEKLRRILKTSMPGTKILTPEGSIIRVDEYKHLMYGVHALKGTVFSCVPTMAYTLDDLRNNLSFDEIKREGNDIILKSKSKITPIVNGRDRTDFVREFYFSNRGEHPVFQGNIFHAILHPAWTLDIATEDGEVCESIRELDGVHCSPTLQYIYRRNSHHLAVYIPHFRLKSEALAGGRIAMFSDFYDDPLFEQDLDQDGFGISSDRTIPIKSPSAGLLKLYAGKSDSMEPISVNGIEVEYEVNLESSILFPIFAHKNFPLRPKEYSSPFGGRRFVLFLSKTKRVENIETENLDITDEGECGTYRVVLLEWKDHSTPCLINVDSNTWKFEQCLDLRMYLRKLGSHKFDLVKFNEYQAKNLQDFQLIVYPYPHEKIQEDLFWNIVVNNLNPYKTRFIRCPKGKSDGKTIRFSGDEIAELLEPVWNEKTGGSAIIEIFLCISDMVLAGVKFWLFPEIKIIPPELLHEGDEVNLRVQHDETEKIKIVALKDRRGRSKALFRINFQGEQWKILKKEYSGSIDINKLGTSLDLCLVPDLQGIILASRITYEKENLRNFLKRELDNLDVIIATQDIQNPTVMVNGEKSELVFTRAGKILSTRLDQLKPSITEIENRIEIRSGDESLSFIVQFGLSVEKIDFREHLINNCIIGKCAFTGPKGSGLRFEVYGNDKPSEKTHITNLDIACDGEMHEDYAINIPIDPQIVKKYQCFTIKLILEFDIDNEDTFHGYGKMWTVKTTEELVEHDYDYLKSNSISCFDDRRYFAAKRFLELAKELAPKSEEKWIEEFMMRINFLIKKQRVNSIIRQIYTILDKELKLEFDITAIKSDD